MNEIIQSGAESVAGTSRRVSTPISEDGVRALFEGLAAVHEATVFGAPAAAAIAITPSLIALLQHYCGHDPRYAAIMTNIWAMEYRSMKEHSIRTSDQQFDARRPGKQSLLDRLSGRPHPKGKL